MVALVLQVRLEQDLAHAHEPGHRGQGRHVERALLDGLVQGLDAGWRPAASRRHDLAGHVRPVEQARGDRVLGDPPGVGGEVLAGQSEHPRSTGPEALRYAIASVQ